MKIARVRIRVVCAAAFVIIIAGMAWMTRQRANGEAYLAHGEVSCRSGQAPIGIWVSASHGDAGWAEIAPTARPGSIGFVRRIKHGGDYAVNVGCGGTPSDWRMSATSALHSAGWVSLTCHDVRPPMGRPAGWLPLAGGSRYGRCVAG